MSKRYLLGFGVVAALVASSLPASAAGHRDIPDVSVRWSLGVDSPFGGTRFDGSYVASQGLVYFLGFRTFSDATDGSIWTYDPVARVYADTGTDLRQPISNYQIAPLTDSSGSALYVFGGRDPNGVILTTVQAYYPATGQQRNIVSDPWPGQTPAGCVSLPAMGVISFQNKAIVAGGLSFTGNGCVDDQSAETWIFDPMAAPGTKWSPGPPLNVARGYITMALLQGRIYAIGGDTVSGGLLFATPTVESWKPFGGGWNDVAVADLPVPCDESQAFAFASGPLRRDIVLGGCGQWGNALPDTYLFDSALGTWSLVGSLREPRRNQAGEMLPGGTMYILGGYDCPGNTCLADPTVLSENGRGAPAGPGSLGWTSRRSVGAPAAKPAAA